MSFAPLSHTHYSRKQYPLPPGIKPTTTNQPTHNSDLWRITKFLREKGYGADVAACRAAFPGLLTFPEFLVASRWGDAARTYEDGIEFDFGAAGAGAPVTAAAQQQQGQ
jgi:hypothetical protein